MTTSTEGVHTAVAAYAQHLDAGRSDELVELFTPDGKSEIVGIATYAGRDELLAGYAAMAPSAAQLHLTGNTVVTGAGENVATATSDLAFFKREDDGWHLVLTGRYVDTLRRTGDRWCFTERVLTLQM